MAEQTVSLETISDFLAQKRIAMVGISREGKDFSISFFEEMARRGYDMVPVNPNASQILGGLASLACGTSSLRLMPCS